MSTRKTDSKNSYPKERSNQKDRKYDDFRGRDDRYKNDKKLKEKRSRSRSKKKKEEKYPVSNKASENKNHENKLNDESLSIYTVSSNEDDGLPQKELQQIRKKITQNTTTITEENLERNDSDTLKNTNSLIEKPVQNQPPEEFINHKNEVSLEGNVVIPEDDFSKKPIEKDLSQNPEVEKINYTMMQNKPHFHEAPKSYECNIQFDNDISDNEGDRFKPVREEAVEVVENKKGIEKMKMNSGSESKKHVNIPLVSTEKEQGPNLNTNLNGENPSERALKLPSQDTYGQLYTSYDLSSKIQGSENFQQSKEKEFEITQEKSTRVKEEKGKKSRGMENEKIGQKHNYRDQNYFYPHKHQPYGRYQNNYQRDYNYRHSDRRYSFDDDRRDKNFKNSERSNNNHNNSGKYEKRFKDNSPQKDEKYDSLKKKTHKTDQSSDTKFANTGSDMGTIRRSEDERYKTSDRRKFSFDDKTPKKRSRDRSADDNKHKRPTHTDRPQEKDRKNRERSRDESKKRSKERRKDSTEKNVKKQSSVEKHSGEKRREEGLHPETKKREYKSNQEKNPSDNGENNEKRYPLQATPRVNDSIPQNETKYTKNNQKYISHHDSRYDNKPKIEFPGHKSTRVNNRSDDYLEKQANPKPFVPIEQQLAPSIASGNKNETKPKIDEAEKNNKGGEEQISASISTKKNIPITGPSGERKLIPTFNKGNSTESKIIFSNPGSREYQTQHYRDNKDSVPTQKNDLRNRLKPKLGDQTQKPEGLNIRDRIKKN